MTTPNIHSTDQCNNKIDNCFEDLYQLLLEARKLHFPPSELVANWETVLNSWISDERLPLFIRQPSKGRGILNEHESGRWLRITDNTPAHWVYKKNVIDNEPLTFIEVRLALTNNNFPLAMAKKQVEIDLKKTEVASRKHLLGNENWYLAHIKPIALSGGNNKTIEDYVAHHRNFLSLDNMYLISKEYKGLAEVEMFNDIVIKNKTAPLTVP
jgi:hypothetical protein